MLLQKTGHYFLFCWIESFFKLFESIDLYTELRLAQISSNFKWTISFFPSFTYTHQSCHQLYLASTRMDPLLPSQLPKSFVACSQTSSWRHSVPSYPKVAQVDLMTMEAILVYCYIVIFIIQLEAVIGRWVHCGTLLLLQEQVHQML